MAYNSSRHEYEKKVYDRIPFRVSKGNADYIRAAANDRGESLNVFIEKAVLSRLGLTEWPSTSTASKGYTAYPLPACIICGNPLPEGKMRYCSDECKREGHRRSAVESLRRKRLSQSQPSED